jgi:hypothetical protein
VRSYYGSERRIAAQTQALPAVPEPLRPMCSVNGSALGAELTARLVCLALGLRGRAHSAKAARFASSPRSRLGRDNRGFLDLTDNGEFVLDREVGNQYTHGLASII